MNWHPQIRHHTGVSKVPSASMEENQIRDPSCLFSPSNSVNTNSFVKANWFCTMQFPKDVFWVKLITSHNKICFNPINVRWLCLDPMCVCVFFMFSTCLCAANPFCSIFLQCSLLANRFGTGVNDYWKSSLFMCISSSGGSFSTLQCQYLWVPLQWLLRRWLY